MTGRGRNRVGTGARIGLASLWALALVIVPTPPHASGQSTAAAFGTVPARLRDIAELKGKKLGVGEFPSASGRVTELGTFLADQLDVALTAGASAAGFEIVTRNRLCEVIRENKLWVDDRFDPSLNRKLGRLSQADFMATGQVTALSRDVTVSIRLVETETGRSVWAHSLSIPLDEGLRGLATRSVVGDGCGGSTATVASTPSPLPPSPPAAFPPPGRTAAAGATEPLRVKIWTDKPSYTIGDTVTFNLRVSRDAYVTLVNIGTSGDVTVMYPNRFQPSNFVRAGKDVTIPSSDSGFSLKVQGPAGFDQVRAIATEEPVKLQASDFPSGGTALFRSLDRVQTRNFVVEISQERSKVSPDKWAEEVIAVEVKR